MLITIKTHSAKSQPNKYTRFYDSHDKADKRAKSG